MKSLTLLNFVFIVAELFTRISSSKILLVPIDHGSHMNYFSVVGETLQENGHDVYILCTEQFTKIARKHHLKEITLESTAKIDVIQDQVIGKSNNNILQLLSMKLNATKTLVRELFGNKQTMATLKEMNFDLMIMDGFDVWRYMYALPYKLSIPYISITPRPDPWTVRVPALPSIEGVMPLYIIDESTTIFQRLFNAVVYIVPQIVFQLPFLSPVTDDIISELVPERPNIGFTELYTKSEIILVNTDTICLDFPRVSSPFYQYIGGLGVQPAKPLTSDLDKIVTSAASNGVIVLTFGSGIKSLPIEMLYKLLSVFKQRQEIVLIRDSRSKTELEENSIAVPRNVHLISWLPQNDLLAHKNTKLFISHGGNNGQMEAAYHGVPVLTMPMFGDQFYNARRMDVHQYGKQLDPTSFTEEQLAETVNELIVNSVYRNNIKKCSKILKKLPAPQKQVLFWVDHILEFGSGHLKPFYVNMPLWKFLMLDVALLVGVSSLLIFCMIRYCCSRMCKSKSIKGKSKSGKGIKSD